MRGIVEVDRNTGFVMSQLSQVAGGASLSELSKDKLDQISQCLRFILQDVNMYHQMNGGEAELGNLHRITLKLDDHHFVNIVCGQDKIKAHVEPIKAGSP